MAFPPHSLQMQPRNGDKPVNARAQSMLAGLAGHAPEMQRRALQLDRSGDFPLADLERLRELGTLAAPLPVSLGGLGLGTEPDGAINLLAALRLIGSGSLSVGRVYEAHVNAIRLIVRHGTRAQVADAAQDALAGHLFGLWVTDAGDAPLRIDTDGALRGAKFPCSAAGHATRAVVTAATVDGHSRMLLLRLPQGARADLSDWDPHGMRATGSGRMNLDGLYVSEAFVIGVAGDYLRQPDFSAGAWRTSAVTLGGLDALLDQTRIELMARGRHADQHQLARMGEALIAQETARLWITQAATIGEGISGTPGEIANYVNLARLAAESACLDAIRLVQRSLGLQAFRRGTLAELLFRDLGMYLRQPAPDVTLTESAAYFMRHKLRRRTEEPADQRGPVSSP